MPEDTMFEMDDDDTSAEAQKRTNLEKRPMPPEATECKNDDHSFPVRDDDGDDADSDGAHRFFSRSSSTRTLTSTVSSSSWSSMSSCGGGGGGGGSGGGDGASEHPPPSLCKPIPQHVLNKDPKVIADFAVLLMRDPVRLQWVLQLLYRIPFGTMSYMLSQAEFVNNLMDRFDIEGVYTTGDHRGQAIARSKDPRLPLKFRIPGGLTLQ